MSALSSALMGKIHTLLVEGFCGKAQAGKQVLLLCIYCCDFILKCTPAKKHFQHRAGSPLVDLQFLSSLYHRFFLCGGCWAGSVGNCGGRQGKELGKFYLKRMEGKWIP